MPPVRTNNTQTGADSLVAAMEQRVRNGLYAGTAITRLNQMDEKFKYQPYATFKYVWMMSKATKSRGVVQPAQPTLHMLAGWTFLSEAVYAIVAANDNCQFWIVQDITRSGANKVAAGDKIVVWADGLQDQDIRIRANNLNLTRNEIIKRALKAEENAQILNGNAPSRNNTGQLMNAFNPATTSTAFAATVAPPTAGPVANNTAPFTSYTGQLMNASNLAMINTAVAAAVAPPTVAGPVATLDSTLHSGFNTFAANQANVTFPADVNMVAYNQADGTVLSESNWGFYDPINDNMPDDSYINYTYDMGTVGVNPADITSAGANTESFFAGLTQEQFWGLTNYPMME